MITYENFQKRVDEYCARAINEPSEVNVSAYRKVQKDFNEWKASTYISVGKGE